MFVEDDLRCAVCLDIYVKPVVLACGHSFCEYCASEALNFYDSCPLCRSRSVSSKLNTDDNNIIGSRNNHYYIRNLSLDIIVQRFIDSCNESDRLGYMKNFETKQNLFRLKKSARRILWEVSQRCQHNGFYFDNIETLYNEIQYNTGKTPIVFDQQLLAELRLEAIRHDGLYFRIDYLSQDRIEGPFQVFLINNNGK